MKQIILLVISLLSSSSALNRAANSDGLQLSKRESPLEQLFPSLRLNGSMLLREVTSAINYANSTIRRTIEETRNMFNLTADQYNPDEMTVIMAFPMYNTSLHSNESLTLNNSSSNGNSSYGLNEVKDSPNFSPRFLDLNELLSLLQTPLNLLNKKLAPILAPTVAPTAAPPAPPTPAPTAAPPAPPTTASVIVEPTPPVVVEPTYPVYAEHYPAVPVVPMVPVVPVHVPYPVSEAPYVTYEEPNAPNYAPAPEKYAPAPEKYAPAPEKYAPVPVNYAPAPAPETYAPAPVNYAPAPVNYAPAPETYEVEYKPPASPYN